MNHVIKRNQDTVIYNPLKIKNAVFKSCKATGLNNLSADNISVEITNQVDVKLSAVFNRRGIVNVEQIQNIVEQVLMGTYKKVAKKYIIYRYQRGKVRFHKKKYHEAMNMIDDYLDISDWKVNENSNMGYSLQGLHNRISSDVVEQYWLQEVYPEEIRNCHRDGDIHIHDLSTLGPYCCGWDLQDILENGFGGVDYKTESHPPKHFQTALLQSVNFMFTVQGEAAGAQAFSNFDTFLAPFIYYDNLNYNEVYQAIQGFIFNLNVPTRVGFQTPFSNITMDLNCPSNLKNEPVIIGGKRREESCYGDFQEEMDLLNQVFAEVMLQGDKKGRVFSFPIPTYNITKDFDWDNEIYDPIWEMTAKYGIPYFANFVNSDMDPEDVRSMCCRLRLDNRELRKRGGGLFGSNPLTGSIGVVTLNMARIGYETNNKEEYINRVYELMDVSKESLIIKRKFIEHRTDGGLYPYSQFFLRDVKQRFGKYWQNHFNTIGINGMNESCLNFLGKDIGDNEGKEFAEWVMNKMRERMVLYQDETDQMFNLEATPAEGTSYSLAKLDKEKYGSEIVCANERRVREENAEPYYTNSSQLPVGYTDDIFEAFELQDELQSLYTGGTVLHVFLGERLPNIKSTKKLVRTLANNFRLPYFSITPTFSICPIHGYLPGEHEFCPKCDAER